VREEPMLYDKTNANYKNAQMKIRKWNSFATVLAEIIPSTSESPVIELEGDYSLITKLLKLLYISHKFKINFVGKEVKEKWQYLKDRFTKERSRLEKLYSGSGLKDAVPIFNLYSDMMFLEAYVSRRKITKRKLLSSDDVDEAQSEDDRAEPDNFDQNGPVLNFETGVYKNWNIFMNTGELSVY
jgi:hypothetical protein